MTVELMAEPTRGGITVHPYVERYDSQSSLVHVEKGVDVKHPQRADSFMMGFRLLAFELVVTGAKHLFFPPVVFHMQGTPICRCAPPAKDA